MTVARFGADEVDGVHTVLREVKMGQDNSKKNNSSAGSDRREYTLGVNGVEITVASETGKATARELLELAKKANALVQVNNKKIILEDDDGIYEGDDEVDLQKSEIFIALPKYEGTESLRDRTRYLIPSDSVHGRR